MVICKDGNFGYNLSHVTEDSYKLNVVGWFSLSYFIKQYYWDLVYKKDEIILEIDECH